MSSEDKLRSLFLVGLASVAVGISRGSSVSPHYILMGDFSTQEEKTIEQVMDPILANYDLSGLNLVFIDWEPNDCMVGGWAVHSSKELTKEFPYQLPLPFPITSQYLDHKDVIFIKDLDQLNKEIEKKWKENFQVSEQGYSYWVNAPHYKADFAHELSHLLLDEFPEEAHALKKAFLDIDLQNLETILDHEDGVARGHVSFLSHYYMFSVQPWYDEATDLVTESIAETMAYVLLDLHYADWDEIAMQKINLVKEFLRENYSY